MANENTPATERPQAPVTEPQYIQPRHKQIERQGVRSEPYVRRYPQVRGGVCEFCGVLDRNVPSEQQYKLCPHYRNMQLRCSYCDEAKDVNDVIYKGILNVAESPDDTNTLIVWCNNYDCVRKHENRFQRNR